jgi:hypothetical protein
MGDDNQPAYDQKDEQLLLAAPFDQQLTGGETERRD